MLRRHSRPRSALRRRVFRRCVHHDGLLPARLPRYPNAASAEQAGYRPCLRCRPELAPGSAQVDAVKRVAHRAAELIKAGALTDSSLEALATEFGLSSRQLRRAVEREYGVSPMALAQTYRLLLAKQLLTDSELKIVDVAFASGFSSVRRFNDAFRNKYRLNPSALRRKGTGQLPVQSRQPSVGMFARWSLCAHGQNRQ